MTDSGAVQSDGAPVGDGGVVDTTGDAPAVLPEDEPPDRPIEPDDGGPLVWDGGSVVEEEDEEEVELVPAGGACDCDSDCERTDGYDPLCIHGICGVRSTNNACAAGSTSECPSGHRCWSGTGQGVCYPDYVSGSCAGSQDADGSCIASSGQDCYSACGALCGLPGDPPGTVDPDDDPPPVDPGDCEYPGGPYGLGQGRVIAPMRWPSAVTGTAESGSADLEDLHCNPDVSSIFIDVGATWCPSCGDRMREIASLRDHWNATGVTWIFIVSDAGSASSASDYVDRYGIDFGFRTNDADNSEGGGTIASSSLFATIPWVGIVRPDDMLMLYDEASSGYLDLAGIASDLAE